MQLVLQCVVFTHNIVTDEGFDLAFVNMHDKIITCEYIVADEY